MCYLVYISTDFDGDLALRNSTLVSFEKDFTHTDPAIVDLLLYKHLWYVGSNAGCSCTFRHLPSVGLGFGEPVEWFPEEADEIEATKMFYDVIADLKTAGHKVDCIEIWAGTRKDEIKRLTVHLDNIPRDAFRFFENHHFIFSNDTAMPTKRSS